MKNKRLAKIKSTLLPLMVDGIDTDQIMPGKYLIWISKTGYDKVLFENWRYEADGKTLNKSSIFNDKRYKKAKILITGKNFGFGSSREHAVWALMQYGFKVIIAPSFHDIFSVNASKNGLLLIKLNEKIVYELANKSIDKPSFALDINVKSQTIKADDIEYKFEIDEFVKEKIINGFDDITYILAREKLISKWEQQNL